MLFGSMLGKKREVVEDTIGRQEEGVLRTSNNIDSVFYQPALCIY